MAIKILNDLLPIAEQTEVGVVKPDNVSITITETGELQSSVVDLPEEVVTAENYDNPKLWKGTLEEYNAIETKNPLVTYIITDDNVETLKTTDYNALSNKPSINDVTLEGNKTLEDLNIQAADTSLTTSQITNCITKIPQDIKLELADGTLTLKAGSKVYKGDGTAVNIMSDVSSTNGGTSTGFKLLFTSGTGFGAYLLEQCISSDTNPGAGYQIWFNTSDKIIYKDDNKAGNFEATNWSLPIAIITTESSAITSINQVFNGFGYIDKTRFILPGVEFLIPKGRNTNGSLNNLKYITEHVGFINRSDNFTGKIIIAAGLSGNIGEWTYEYYTESDIKPTPAASVWRWFDTKNNLLLETRDTGATWTQITAGVFGYETLENSVVTSFTPKMVFQAIDRNDTEWASTASKPSDRYIDLTLGASGSTYTAPANGWFSLWQKDSTASAGKITIRNTKTRFGVGTENSITGYTNLILPVHKNEQIAIYYTNITATDFQFRFIYDEGVR